MVENPRAAARPHALRSLNLPRPIAVEARPAFMGRLDPIAISEASRRRRIERVEDRWDIDDEWWLRQIQRRYFQVALEGGVIRTIYHDLGDECWYAQGY